MEDYLRVLNAYFFELITMRVPKSLESLHRLLHTSEEIDRGEGGAEEVYEYRERTGLKNQDIRFADARETKKNQVPPKDHGIRKRKSESTRTHNERTKPQALQRRTKEWPGGRQKKDAPRLNNSRSITNQVTTPEDAKGIQAKQRRG